jgi:hypothetical protein
MYAFFAVASLIYLRLYGDESDTVANADEWKNFDRPVRYEKMKLGVRYGAMDIHEKY